ncbi:hypothetical protein D3C76_761810 [compost metagenome]
MEQVIDLGFDAGDFLDQLAVLLGLCGDQAVGFEAGTQVGGDHFGVAVGVVGIHQCAMQRRGVGLGAVVDLAGETTVGEQLGERHEIGVGFDAVAAQGGAGDFWRLGDDPQVFLRVPALGCDSAQQHAVGRGGERHGNGLALEFGQRLHTGSRRHHDAVATALDAARQHTDEQAALAGIEVRDAIERAGEIGHGAEVELAGNHFVGQRRAAGEVLPFDLVLRILVLAVVRQVLLQQAQLADQQAAGGAVDGGVLGADGDADGFGAGVQASERQREAGHGCNKAHGCFPSSRYKSWVVSAARLGWWETRGTAGGRPVVRRMAG